MLNGPAIEVLSVMNIYISDSDTFKKYHQLQAPESPQATSESLDLKLPSQNFLSFLPTPR